MKKQPETRFKERIMPLLLALPYSYFEKIQQVSVRGTLDVQGCVRGQCVVLELKTDEGETDGLQEWKLGKWREAGAMAMVVTPTNWPEVYNSLQLMAAGKMEFKKINRPATGLQS